jgi:hypothetical protein
MLNLLTHINVAEASNVANNVRLTNIMDGVDGAAVMGYTIEEITINTEDNQTRNIAFDHNLDIRVIDKDADTDVLKDIVDGAKEVILSALTPNGFLLWTLPTKLVINRQFDSIVALAVKATKRTPHNYYGTAPEVNKGIYAGGNAMALYSVLTGTSTRVNGWKTATGITFDTNESGGVLFQNLTRVSGSELVKFERIYLPFPGHQFTFTVDRDADAIGKIGVSYINAAGSEISSDEESIPASEGTTSVTFTLPANTVYIDLYVAPGETASDELTVSKPRLRVGTETGFTA